MADATVYGALDVEVPAISKIRDLREQAQRTDQAVERLGRRLDSLASPRGVQGIRSVRDELRSLERQAVTTTQMVTQRYDRMVHAIEGGSARAVTAVRTVKTELEELGAMHATASVDVDGIARSRAEIAALREDLRAFGREHATATARVNRSGGGLPGPSPAALPGLPSPPRRPPTSPAGADAGGGGARLSVGSLSLPFGASPALMAGLLPVIPQVSGALLALTGSLASATVGFTEMGVAAGGVALAGLSSIAAVAIPAVSSITQVISAQDALTKARQNTMGVLDAQRQNTNAVQQAEFGVVSAQHSAQMAQQDLTQARRDAVRAITDMTLAERSARLEAESGNLQLARARQALMRAQLNPLSTPLDLQEASLGVKEAQLQADRSRIGLHRAVTDARRTQARGVEGARPVRDAEFALRSARNGLQQARFGLQTAVIQLRRGASGIAQAKQALDQAFARAPQGTRQLVSDIQRLRAMFGAGLGFRGINPQIARAQSMVVRIADGMVRTLQSVAGKIGRTAQIALRGVQPAVQIFQRFMRSRAFARDMRALAGAFAQNAPGLAQATVNLARAFLNLSVAVAPFLKLGTQWLVRVTANWAKMAGDTRTIRQHFRGHLADLRTWWNMIKAAGRLIADLVRGGRTSGRGMVRDFTQTLNRWDAWVRNNPDKIRAFFRDSVRSTERILSVIGKIISSLWNLGRALAPVLNTLVGAAGSIAPLFGSPVGALAGMMAFRGGAGVLTGLRGNHKGNYIGRLGQALGGGARGIVSNLWGRARGRGPGGGLFSGFRLPGAPAGGPGGGGMFSRFFQRFQPLGSTPETAMWVRVVGGLPPLGGGAPQPGEPGYQPGPGGGGRGGDPRLSRGTRLRTWLGRGTFSGMSEAELSAAYMRGGFNPELEAEIARRTGAGSRLTRLGGFLGRIPGVGRLAGLANAGSALGRVGSILGGVGKVGGLALGAAAKIAWPLAALQGGLAFLSKQGTIGERAQATAHALSFGIIHDSLTNVDKRNQGSKYAGEFLQNVQNDPNFHGFRGVGDAQGAAARIDRELARIRGMGHVEGHLGTETQNVLGRTYRTQMDVSLRDTRQYNDLLRARNRLLAAGRAITDRRSGAHGEQLGAQLGQVFDVYLKKTGDARKASADTVKSIKEKMRDMHSSGVMTLGQISLDWARHQVKLGRMSRANFDQLKNDITDRMQTLGSNIEIVNGRIYRNADQAWSGIHDSLTSWTEKTLEENTKGFTQMQKNAVNALVQMGWRRGQAQNIVTGIGQGGQVGQVANDVASGNAGYVALHNTRMQSHDPNAHNQSNILGARGMRIRGQGLQDTVPVAPGHLAAPGELIVNRHTESRLNRVLSLFGTSMGREVAGETRPHYMARGGYVNPFVDTNNLVPERIDMGVDYSGSGPVRAIGPGRVVTVTNVPQNQYGGGGGWVTYQLTSGSKAGQYVFLGEHVSPSVRQGARVHAGQKIASISGGIETGWAAGPGAWNTMAAHLHEQNPNGDPGAWTSAAGADFSHFLQSLGAPGGNVVGGIHGSRRALRNALGSLSIAGGSTASGPFRPIRPALTRRTGVPGGLQQAGFNAYANGMNRILHRAWASGGGGGGTGGHQGHFDPHGTRLSRAQVQRLWTEAGGPRSMAHMMANIAWGESSWNPRAQNPLAVNGLHAQGLWQILGKPFPGNAFDPLTNARMAVAKWRSGGIHPWDASAGVWSQRNSAPAHALGGRIPGFGGWFAKGGHMRVRGPLAIGVGDGQPSGGSEEVSVRRVRPGDHGGHGGAQVSVKVDMGGVTIQGGDSGDAERLADSVAEVVARKLDEALRRNS